ncbi:MAG: glycosyltransferase family 4 protein [Janthinobacterium lividum]
MNIHIITAALPPELDGIGDYSAQIAAQLARTSTVKVLTAQESPAAIPGVAIETVFSISKPRSVWNLVQRIAAEPPDWVLLQYNPFSFGRWGLNLHLPLVMRQIKQRCPNVRVAVMAHETFVPFRVNWKFWVMSLWQRPQFALMSHTADILFFSIESWAQVYRGKLPGKQIIHLPVGSNIPCVPISRAEARGRLGISDDVLVLGVFGAMHLSRRMDWVRDAARAVCNAGREVVVLYVGPGDAAVRAQIALPLIAGGPFEPEEVSRRFAAMDIHLTPFTDGVSTRRGSLMTGLQHGIATVGTSGIHTDSILREADGKAFLLAEANRPEQFISHVLRLAEDSALRERIGQEGRRLYDSEFYWGSIAERLLGGLTKATLRTTL